MLELLVFEWDRSILRAEHDGACYVFTFENELSIADTMIQEIEVDGHRVSVYFGPGAGELPDWFIVDKHPAGFQVSEPMWVEEGEEGVILSCPALLG